MPVRIMIFEDNDNLRKSLVTLLATSDEFQVVGSYANANNVEAILGETFPEVIIMDIDMPGRDGISAVPTIKEIYPETSIIMYTQYEDDDKLFRSISVGADGYILKKTPVRFLFEAINEVYEGGAPMSPSIAKKVLSVFRNDYRDPGKIYELTPKEIEILHLLIKGFSVKLIASEMKTSYETTKTHLKNIYRKLHVNCGKEAIAKVLAKKIIY